MSNQNVPTADTLPIPTYKIDLSLPPHLRYVKLAQDFAPKMRTLTHLFDDIVASVTPNKFLQKVIKLVSSFFLFRLYSSEETQEVRGIAEASGVPLYLIVALNVILDSLLGCTSGAVKTAVKNDVKSGKTGNEDEAARMIHFRTLDWGMDPLRDVLVVIEFVRSDSVNPDEVLARSVTYAGFVGVLTGVRKELSLSLNFRPYHECTTRSLRTYQLAVLFGLRPSISSLLRQVILPSLDSNSEIPSLSQVTKQLETTITSPCYLILSTSTEAAVLEKDLKKARILTSNEFIVATNCDCAPKSSDSPLTAVNHNAAGMDMVLDEADERKETVEKRFKDVKKRQEKKWKEANGGDMTGFQVSVRESTVLGWLQVYPVWNELTHFGCLLDPREGQIRWNGRGVLYENDKVEGEEKRPGWRSV